MGLAPAEAKASRPADAAKASRPTAAAKVTPPPAAATVTPPPAGPPVLTYDPAQGLVDLTGPYLEILPDPAGKLSLAQVLEAGRTGLFRPAAGPSLNLGLGPGAYWLRFSYQALPAVRQPLLFRLGNPHAAAQEAFVGTPGALPAAWQPLPALNRGTLEPPATHRKNYLFRLPPPATGVHSVIVRVHSFSPLCLGPGIGTMGAVTYQARLGYLAVGLYLGIIAGLLVYNLFIFLALRDRSYLWYVLAELFLAAYLVGSNGLLDDLVFPHGLASDLTSRIMNACSSLAFLAGVLFTRRFLATALRAPVLDRVLTGAVVILVLLLGAGPLAPVAPVSNLLALAGVLLPALLLSTGLVVWRRGFAPARWYVAAWFLMLAGVAAYTLTFLQVLPFSFWTMHGIMLGSAVEAVLLSLALAERIRTLERDRRLLAESESLLSRISRTDSLTGLFNRRLFDEEFPRLVREAGDHRRPLSLLMLDVDNFKSINDRAGHAEGDRVLKRVAHICRLAVRGDDLLFRLGGDEFAILAPLTSLAGGQRLAERIREILAGDRTKAGPEAGGVSVSIGLAQLADGEDGEGLFLRADRALYKAKDGGKDQVRSSPWPTAAGGKPLRPV